MLYDGLDIYQAKIEDEIDGVYTISLVDFPAVEKNFVCFKKDQKQQMKFSIESEEKRNITGVVMLADTPIYRRNGDYEYYITYSKETIEKMANKLLKDGFQNRVDLQHDGELITGISMMELYIKDSSKGINPSFIEDIPDGSLLATFHVEDENLWDEIKNGDVLNGFSLEGLFTVEKMNNNKINKKNMSKLTKFMKSLMKFGEISTDKGNLYWEGEDELAVGVEVYVDGEDETKVIAEDGEYIVDEKTIVVVDGKVSEIREKEEPEIEETVEVSASKQKFNKMKEIFEETYQEKENKIITAIRAKGFDCWLVEASDEYAIVEVWVDETADYKHYRFPITWNGEEAVAGDPEEVKSEYVPVNKTEEPTEPTVVEEQYSDETTEEQKPEEISVENPDEPKEDKRDEKEERIERLETTIVELQNEIASIKDELAKLNNVPAVEPIVEEFEAVNKKETKTNKAAKLFSHLNG